MLQSMTGYGKSICELEAKKIVIEVKSLNSKQFDLNLRFPGIYREKELSTRNKLSKKLIRGKVDLSIYIENNSSNTKNRINQTLVADYYKQISEINNKLNLENSTEILLQSVLSFPDILETKREEINEEEWNEISKHIDNAIDKLLSFRKQEGEVLEEDISKRINLIESLLKEVDTYEHQRIERIKDRIKDNFKEFGNKLEIDINRFEQELIFYLEKLDITEEKVRLSNHCKYFMETIKEPGSIGKKLGFVSQEIGREINTLGSKANDADIQKIVIKMKDELEKIKEQLLNVL